MLRSGHLYFDLHYTVIMRNCDVAQSSPHRSNLDAFCTIPDAIYHAETFYATLLHERCGWFFVGC